MGAYKTRTAAVRIGCIWSMDRSTCELQLHTLHLNIFCYIFFYNQDNNIPLESWDLLLYCFTLLNPTLHIAYTL